MQNLTDSKTEIENNYNKRKAFTKLLKELFKDESFKEELDLFIESGSTFDPNQAIFKEGQRNVVLFLKGLVTQQDVYYKQRMNRLNTEGNSDEFEDHITTNEGEPYGRF